MGKTFCIDFADTKREVNTMINVMVVEDNPRQEDFWKFLLKKVKNIILQCP